MSTIPYVKSSDARGDSPEWLRLPVACVNWPEYDLRPEAYVSFRHDGRALYVRFDVVEPHVRALEPEDNRPVCPDSCVECFVLCGDGRYYINFECNPLGTVLAARRPERKSKTPLTSEELRRIVRRGSCVGREPFEERSEGGVCWWLELEVPFDLLGYESVPEELRLNAYKCGDATDRRHYLTLYPIQTERPDFHRPECFRRLKVAKEAK